MYWVPPIQCYFHLYISICTVLLTNLNFTGINIKYRHLVRYVCNNMLMYAAVVAHPRPCRPYFDLHKRMGGEQQQKRSEFVVFCTMALLSHSTHVAAHTDPCSASSAHPVTPQQLFGQRTVGKLIMVCRKCAVIYDVR